MSSNTQHVTATETQSVITLELNIFLTRPLEDACELRHTENAYTYTNTQILGRDAIQKRYSKPKRCVFLTLTKGILFLNSTRE